MHFNCALRTFSRHLQLNVKAIKFLKLERKSRCSNCVVCEIVTLELACHKVFITPSSFTTHCKFEYQSQMAKSTTLMYKYMIVLLVTVRFIFGYLINFIAIEPHAVLVCWNFRTAWDSFVTNFHNKFLAVCLGGQFITKLSIHVFIV